MQIKQHKGILRQSQTTPNARVKKIRANTRINKKGGKMRLKSSPINEGEEDEYLPSPTIKIKYSEAQKRPVRKCQPSSLDTNSNTLA
jgi:hypothetical protein